MATAMSSGLWVRRNAVFTDSSAASFFLSSRNTVSVLIRSTRAVSRTATGVETHVNDLVFHLRQPPKVSVVQRKLPRGTRSVLAQVPLGPAACFAAFDDLLTLTMWTPDGDERHETLPVSGRCQERAQCDINLSPSPHLEHYPLIETHLPDIRVALSISQGKMRASTILRKLGTHSHKNKPLTPPFVSRARARSSSSTLRVTRRCADHQCGDQYRRSVNGFVQWVAFGGEGIIRQNNREEQRKSSATITWGLNNNYVSQKVGGG